MPVTLTRQRRHNRSRQLCNFLFNLTGCLLTVFIITSTTDLLRQNDCGEARLSEVRANGEVTTSADTNLSEKYQTTSPRPTLTTTQSPAIINYLKEEERLCLKYRRTLTSHHVGGGHDPLPACPCLPPGLKGPLNTTISADPGGWHGLFQRLQPDSVDEQFNKAAPTGSAAAVNRIRIGGEWKPATCRSNIALAVIIPCRDRDEHLQILMSHLYPILQRQLAHFRIFVVEQNSPEIFNKAAMMNIGFLEAVKRFPQMNCVMFHDVDLLLEDDRTLMTCSDQPHHYAVTDVWNYRMLYQDLFGGVVSMRPQLFTKVNGLSLQYFGWGAEDDDLGYRVRKHAKVRRPPPVLCKYTALKHPKDIANPLNLGRYKVMAKQYQRYVNRRFDGLTDIVYDLNDVQLLPLYTWIEANLNVDNLNYPNLRSYEYRKFAGRTCRRNGQNRVGRDVSFVTCRYLCDVEMKKPCAGFIYRRDPKSFRPSTKSPASDDIAADGREELQLQQQRHNSHAKCVLLATVCDLVRTTSDDDATTFIKNRTRPISTRARSISTTARPFNKSVVVNNSRTTDSPFIDGHTTQ